MDKNLIYKKVYPSGIYAKNHYFWNPWKNLTPWNLEESKQGNWE